MNDSADKGFNGAEMSVAGLGHANDLASHPILLVGEGKGGEGGRVEFGIGRRGYIKVSGADTESDITKTEGLGVGFGGGVFAGTEEKEECHNDHIGNGHAAYRGRR